MGTRQIQAQRARGNNERTRCLVSQGVENMYGDG